MTAPEWLKSRDGDLRRAPDGNTWLVLLSGTPQYKLNQKRIDKGQTYSTTDEALRGGLDELRGALGW